MNSTHNIVLTGFMATGKTTIAQIVAQKLERVFYDTDALIEQRTAWAISRIFAERGEAYFRTLERGVCHELALRQDCVIATGGGALVAPDSRHALEKTGLVVCLHALPQTIEERISQKDNRPLAAQWRALLEERRTVYASFDLHVYTDHKTPEDVAQEVLHLWYESL